MYDSGPEHSRITALLGPTNTGKTHRAVERMLEHETGMMGLPLRLLARELYDRVSARVGENRVALVTGEERRVPAHPQYWICTVEAMPSLEVDFLAVDEIQLVSHPQRGHVFTQRLLEARGRRETWFLGAATVARLLSRLVPTAKISSHSRLSHLRHRGRSTLRALPNRSAVVAFSVPDVYALAERVRHGRGGAAVVLGALSPRTRNAQVAMYQAGEVDTLVASDAIGMGLNLDLAHVAFASTSKFDGRETRALSAAEFGQIAGRAGRYTRDGSFGTLAPQPALNDAFAQRIEQHAFPALDHAIWRSTELGFWSSAELIESLRQPPPRADLRLIEHADDFSALLSLANQEDVKRRLSGEDRVRLLWQVCQVPDFRQLLPDSHHALLTSLFLQLTDRGRLDPAFIEQRLAELDDDVADVDTLMMRLAFIRTWTYIAHRSDWLDDADVWQQRTRVVEDRLSDALHRGLVSRFVERTRRSHGGSELSAPSGPFAQLATMRQQLAPEPKDPWQERALSARHEAFDVEPSGRVRFDGHVIARLVGAPHLLSPQIVLVDADALAPGVRSRLERRMTAWTRDLCDEVLGSLRRAQRAPDLAAAVRGILYQLDKGLGVASLAGARDQVRALSQEDRAYLADLGVVLGRRHVFVPELLERPAMCRRSALCAAHFGRYSKAMAAGTPIFSCDVEAWGGGGRSAELACNGVALCGGQLVRIDALDELLGALASSPTLPELHDRFPGVAALGADPVRVLLHSLGYQLGPDGKLHGGGRPRRRTRRKRRAQTC